VTVRLPQALRARLDAVATATRRSTSSIIKQALETGLPAIEESATGSLLALMDEVDARQALNDAYSALLGRYVELWRRATTASDDDQARDWLAKAERLRADRATPPTSRDQVVLKLVGLRARYQELADTIPA